MSYAPTPLADRFWIKVAKGGPEECWMFTGHRKRNGYGAITLGGHSGKIEMAHRVAWMLAHGEIPTDKVVDHRCHNRACVNVQHLRLVSGQRNNQNRKGANRTNRSSGVRNVHRGNGDNWVVRLVWAGQLYRLGPFETVEEAAREAESLRREVARREGS